MLKFTSRISQRRQKTSRAALREGAKPQAFITWAAETSPRHHMQFHEASRRPSEASTVTSPCEGEEQSEKPQRSLNKHEYPENNLNNSTNNKEG